ncbi:MAG: autotransporter-associated beta strand repeat-containing protein, partial [Gemmataceae bacterium]
MPSVCNSARTRKLSLFRRFPSLRFEELESRHAPATFTWSGLGANANWSTASNWVGGNAPTGNSANTEDLVFPAGATQLASKNDLTSATFNSITMGASNYNLTGNALTLGVPAVVGSGFVIVNSGATGGVLGMNIQLGDSAGSDQTFSVFTGASLSVTGKLSGTTGATFTKDGTGTLTLTADNSGFTGTIRLNNNSGAMVITNALALGSTSAGTIVGTGSSLQISNVVGIINEPIILNGLGVANDGAMINIAGNNTWNGAITLNSNAAIGSNSGTLTINASISDTGAGNDLYKEGTSEVKLNAANSYRGVTYIENGVLTAGNPLALGASGTAASGTVVRSNATSAGQLRMADPNGIGFTIANEFLTLNGAGPASASNPGAFTNTLGNNTWAGPVTLGSPAPNNADVTMGAAAGTNLTVSGVVSSPNFNAGGGTISLIKRDTGRVILNNANTYNGATLVQQGTLTARDSKALGDTALGTVVSDGATVELGVEAADPVNIPRFDAQGRDLWNDSVTGNPNSLFISETMTLNGLGFGNGGALRNVSGTNIVSSIVALDNFATTASIGSDLDPRPGHPTPDSSYFTADYSLTVTGVIQSLFSKNIGKQVASDFVKVGKGQLILPVANTYKGNTIIDAGWVTVQNDNALGGRINGLGDTVQPSVTVRDGAALHLRPLSAAVGPLTINKNISLSGSGPNLPYQFINGRGALMNLGGDNVITGDISLRGQVGIGVEQLPQFNTSTLTTKGTIKDFPTVQTIDFTSSGSANEQRYVIDTGGNSGTVAITYEMYGIPDSLTVYYPLQSQGGSKIISTGSVSGSATVSANFGPGASNQIEIVMNEGGGLDGTAWDLTNVVITSVSQGGAIVKYGSKTLQIQGPGTYSGDNTIAEGTILAQSDTALGLKSSGTIKSQQSYTDTKTTVNAAATLELAPSVASLNGGVSAGIQMWYENLVLNNPGQQVAVAGAGGTFTLTYGGQTTIPLSINATASQVQAALNSLTTIINDVGSVAVSLSKNIYTVVFGSILSKTAQALIGTATGGAEVTVSGGVAPLVNVSNDNVVRGSVLLNQGSRVSANPDSRLSLLGPVTDATNNLAGGSDLAKRGIGDLTLGGANTFRGTFGIDEGTVSAMNSQAFGSTTGGTIVADGAQLQIIGNLTIAGEPLTIRGSGNGVIPSFPARWLNTGPSPINGAQTPKSLPSTGRVTGVAVDPSDSKVIYVSTAGGGAWKTKDGGLTWLPLFDASIDPKAVMWGGAIAVAPSDPRVIYFGTGEDNGSGDSYAGSGVYKSTDSGLTWTLMTGPGNSNPLSGQTVSKIAVDPTNANVIYLASGDRGVNAVNPGAPGIWRFNAAGWFNLTGYTSINRQSVNGSAPFDAPPNGFGPPKNPGPDDDYRMMFPQSNAAWTDLIIIQDKTPGGVVLRTTLYAALGRATNAAFSNSGATINSWAVRNAVYSSTTFGTNNPTWFIGLAGGAADSRPQGYPVGDITTTVGTRLNYNIKLSGVYDVNSNQDFIYAANVYPPPVTDPNYGKLLDIQKSTSSGQNWQTTQLTPPNYMGNQGWYDTSIVAVDTNRVYVGGMEDSYRTADGGVTWDKITTDISGNGPHVDYHAMTADAAGNVYAGTDGGVWMYDTNLAWSNLVGNMTITEFNAVDAHPTNFNMAAGGSQDNGTELYNNGLAWQWVDSGDGGIVRYNPLNPSIIYHVVNGVLNESVNGGQTWFTLNNLQPPTSGLYFPFVIDPINPRRLVAVGNLTPVQMTLDGGASWTTISGTLGTLSNITAVAVANYQGTFQYDPGFPNVTDILSNTYDQNTIYVGDSTGKFAVTKDNGTSWAVRSLPITSEITSIAVDPANRDTVYVTLGTAPGRAGARIFRSTDAGQNWTDISGNLPLVPTNKIVIDPRTNIGYLANDGGVWSLPNISTTSTFTWSTFGTGMPNVKVKDLVLNQTLNTLTAGTYGRGMYQLFIPNFQTNSGALRVISGSSVWTGPVTLAGNTTIQVDGTQNIQNGIAAASLNIIGVIGDNGTGATLIKTGNGTLTLSGANTYSGQTLVQEGVLQVNNPKALGASSPAATANTIVSAGAALELRSDLELEPVTINGNGIAYNGHFTGALRNVSNNNVYTGLLTFGTNTTIGVDSGTSLTIGQRPGVLAGSGSITDNGNNFGFDKELPGTLVLATANNYGGLTRVVQGALQVQDAAALGKSTGASDATVVLDGAQLQISRNSVTLAPTNVTSEFLSLSGTGIFGTGALINVRGDGNPTGTNDNMWSGPINFTITPNFSPATNPGTQIALASSDPRDTLTINTSITQSSSLASFGLIKVGPGRVTLANANLYTGVTNINDGSLRVQNNLSLGPVSSSAVQTLTVIGTTSSYRLSFNGKTTATIPATSSAATVKAIFEALSTVGAGNTIISETPGVNGKTLTVTFTGALANLDLPLIVASNQAGLTVNVNQVQRGGLGTVVSPNGTLELDATNGPLNIAENLTVGGDGVGGNGALTSVVGNNTYSGPITMASNTTLGATTGNTLTIASSISDPTPLPVPTPRLRKADLGTVVLQNADAYSGKTVVDQGVLRFQNPLSLGMSRNEVQTISNFLSSGTFSLTFNGATTAPIPANAAAIQVENALLALASISGVGGTVTVTSAPAQGGTAFTVTFGGTLANQNLPQIVVSTVVVDTTTPGTSAVSEVQTVQVIATGGQFTLTFNGQTTTPLAVGASALTVQNALNALSTIGGSGNTGSVTVNSSAITGGTLYTITFGGSLANTDVPQLVPTDLTTGIQLFGTTKTDGMGAERQTVTIVATNGTFSLIYGGVSTTPLAFNATAAQVSAALNSLSTIGGVGGSVNVTSYPTAGGQVFTVTFGGTLANMNVPQMLVNTTGGTSATVNTANDGPEGTSVTSGATLQIDGGITMSNEVVTINGPGFNGLGALNSSSGPNTWSIPLILGSNSSVGTATINDSLTFTTPITDQGKAYNLDIVGPGTVFYAGTVDNQYTGTTHVQNGVLVLQQTSGVAIVGPLVVGNTAPAPAANVIEGLDNQIGDNVDVTVNETGRFDLSSKSDTIGTLTVNSGNVLTNSNGQLTTGNVTMTGGTIDIGTDGSVNLTGSVTATSTDSQSAQITGAGTLNLNDDDRQFTVNDGPL